MKLLGTGQEAGREREPEQPGLQVQTPGLAMRSDKRRDGNDRVYETSSAWLTLLASQW